MRCLKHPLSDFQTFPHTLSNWVGFCCVYWLVHFKREVTLRSLMIVWFDRQFVSLINFRSKALTHGCQLDLASWCISIHISFSSLMHLLHLHQHLASWCISFHTSFSSLLCCCGDIVSYISFPLLAKSCLTDICNPASGYLTLILKKLPKFSWCLPSCIRISIFCS